MAEIYALFSGRDCAVRYVGQTAGSLKDRFKEHLAGYDNRLRGWFLEEWKHGFPIRCELLEWCEYDEREVLETRWINRFPNLLNDRKYYRWHERAAVKVPAIIAHKRRYRYDVGGFRGVHYDVGMDRYFVLIYTGGGFEWALGDEVPGLTKSQGGNIWFFRSYLSA